MSSDVQLPGSVELSRGVGNLPVLSVEGEWGSCRVLPYGADVVSWIPRGGTEVLWLGERNTFESGAGIRGGVPICFPWFGSSSPAIPKHGFLWRRPWRLVGAIDDAGKTELRFRLSQNAATLASIWPHRFEADYVVTVGETLGLALEIRNTDAVAFEFEEALHPYFAISDLSAISVDGIGDIGPAGTKVMTSVPGPTRIALRDRGAGRTISVGSEHARSTLVWNPGEAGAIEAGDFAPGEWRSMLCIEPGNVGADAVRLEPDESHRFAVVIGVAPD